MMLPCKGCCYFRTSLIGHWCDYYTTETIYTDLISGERKVHHSGTIKAVNMRSSSGECGPDRELYDTYSRQFKSWLRSKFSILRKG